MKDAAAVTNRHGATTTITLNRPRQLNALNPDLISAMNAALTEAEQDGTTRAIVITGAGPSFCAGADLKYFLDVDRGGDSPISFLREVSALCTRLETSPLPIVAAVHGHAVAGGLELALACDVTVAADSARIGDGHVLNNLLPAAGASVRLPRKVGAATARWMALTGELLSPQCLADAGWIHQIVPEPQLADTALAVAGILSQPANPAQAAYKKLLYTLDALHPDESHLIELDTFEAHWAAHDVPASLHEFFQRRRPASDSTRKDLNEAI